VRTAPLVLTLALFAPLVSFTGADEPTQTTLEGFFGNPPPETFCERFS
jgi:hypothetical protein